MDGPVALCYTLLAGRWAIGRLKRGSIVVARTRTAAEYLAFLTPEEVSELLRVSVYTVRRWIKEGSLPAYKVGRGWRISERAMHEWLSRNQSVVTSHR
jgi:excisionase family DNA binding protein